MNVTIPPTLNNGSTSQQAARLMLMDAFFGSQDVRSRANSAASVGLAPLIADEELGPLAEAALSASLPSSEGLDFPNGGHFRSHSDGSTPSFGAGAVTHESYDALHLSLAGYRDDPFIARPRPRDSRRRRTDPVAPSANPFGRPQRTASDHDRQKEMERAELIEMILESVATVPMALEKIHTNSRLRAALEQEIGEEHALLHRFFEVPLRNDKNTAAGVFGPASGDEPASSSELWAESHGAPSASDADFTDDEPGSDHGDDNVDDESSEYDSEYENDLAEAVNQLVMTEATLSRAERQVSAPIQISNSDSNPGTDKTSNRASNSPRSSIFGVSPGTYSQDGEPAAALWPRQPHQFAFTQEEEEEEVGVRAQDEVYTEMVSSMCEDENFLEEDDARRVGALDKVFEMESSEYQAASQFRSKEEFDAQTLAAKHAASGFAVLNGGGVRIEAEAIDVSDGEVGSEEDGEEGEEEEEEYEVLKLRVFRAKERTGFEANEDWRPRIGSIIGARYRVQMEIGEAVFSRTYKGVDIHSDEAVCLKIIKNSKEYFDQGIDEIRILQFMSDHCDVDEKHLVRLIDFFYFREHLVIVTELLRDNLYELSKLLRDRGHANYFSLPRLKKVAVEVLEALDFLHSLGLIHCDLKPENILISNFTECRVKVIDFGSACFVTDELTSYVQSRSYRAPEVILGLGYDHKIDVWSLGCVIAELYTGDVLFKNDSEQSLLERIIGAIGPIPSDLLLENTDLDLQFTENPAFAMDPETGDGILSPLHARLPTLESLVATTDAQFVDFLRSLLQIHPSERVSAAEALRHPWLQTGVFSSSTRSAA